MHARLDELLTLRDGAPVDASVRAHVQECPQCSAEVVRLARLRERLRSLPSASEEAGPGWDDVLSRLSTSRRRRQRLERIAPYAAAASVVALALFAGLRWVETTTPQAQPDAPLLVLDVTSLDELRAQSQDLDALLAALPERPAVERAGTAVPIDSLEAQVQWLDHQLSVAGAEGREPEEQRLWHDRVEVMNSLLQLRYVEAQQVNL